MSLISVIIPCYNYGWSLPETLDSLLAQTHGKWECIVIDDGSIDNTREVVERYTAKDNRISYAYQLNAGMSAARNLGMKLSNGKYIQFLDADDLLVSTKFEKQISLLESNPDIDLTYGDVRFFRHNEPNILSRSLDMLDSLWMPEIQGNGTDLVNQLVKKNIMVMCAPLMRSSFLRQVGLFAEDLRYMEDWEFWVRCGLANAYFHYDNSPLTWSLVRVHPTSVSRNILKMYKNEIAVRRGINQSLKHFGYSEAIIINKIGVENAIETIKEIARKNIISGNIKEGIKYFLMISYYDKDIRHIKDMFYWLKRRVVT